MKKTKVKLMSSILYYSNFCDHSKKLLQVVSKTQTSKDIHFICIDKRVKDANGKIFIILQNEQKIVMPENVSKVPALLLLNDNYKVLYGDDIYKRLKPQVKQDVIQATKNNMEPSAFAFDNFGGGGGAGISSDAYSFLDQSDDELSVKGNGGMRQMHSYVTLNDSMALTMHLPTDEADYKESKVKEGETSMEALQRSREQDISSISYK